MRVMGIDPGLATVGIGIVEGERGRGQCRCVDHCTIETPSGLPLPVRLAELSHDLQQLLAEVKPDAAVIERIFFATNKQTAIDVAQARGALLLTVQQAGVPILEPTPMQLKSVITGDGKADKQQMKDMLCHLLHMDHEELSRMKDDAADALALGLYGILSNGVWNALE